jgi:ribosomal protein S18 acetylase RimI-like enzyme
MAELRHEIVDVTDRNVDECSLFCLKSKSKEEGYRNKLVWFKKQYPKGLRYKLLRVYEGEKRGLSSRGFIEYAPSEICWRGIDACGWMVIHCIWVVGRNKGHGFGSRLLEACIEDANDMNGVAVVTSSRNWLPRPKLFLKHGFEKVDEIPPLALYVKRLKSAIALPRFHPIAKERLGKYGNGLTILESHQCPYASNAIKAIQRIAEKANIAVRTVHLADSEEAQKTGAHPYGTFCVLLNGKVVSYYPGDVREVVKAVAELGR